MPDPQLSVASAINAFGAELITAMKRSAGTSMFISPYSISQAIVLLLNGACSESETTHQLLDVVFKGCPSTDVVNQGMSELVAHSKESDMVATANSIWVGKGYSLSSTYQHKMQSMFEAEASPISDAATINNWVSNKTHGNIQQLVSDDDISQAILALVNALYFKGDWKHPFKERLTGPMPFTHCSGSVTHDAAMMFQYHDAGGESTVFFSKFITGSGFDSIALKLPYEGRKYSAIIAMPVDDPAAESGPLMVVGREVSYASALDEVQVHMLMHQGGVSTIDNPLCWKPVNEMQLHVPRFEVEYSSQLVEPLQRIGITAPFIPSDLTNILSDPLIRDVCVSQVLHKTKVKVNEQGTEAAAATAMIMLRCVRPVSAAPEPLVLKFDRPFTFMVVHELTQLVLFSGQVHNPERYIQ